MTGIPPDMLLYLVMVQLLPLTILRQSGQKALMASRDVAICQSGLIVLFLLVWGGYGKDSWTYLPGFDGSPFAYDHEWLFWIIGYGLNKIVYDPWPLKLICALGGGIMCYAIVSFFRDHDWRYSVAGLFALLLVPAFYLLMGSAIRQGLAGARLQSRGDGTAISAPVAGANPRGARPLLRSSGGV